MGLTTISSSCSISEKLITAFGFVLVSLCSRVVFNMGHILGAKSAQFHDLAYVFHLALRLALSTVVQHGAFIGEATIYRERATTALRHSTGTFST